MSKVKTKEYAPTSLYLGVFLACAIPGLILWMIGSLGMGTAVSERDYENVATVFIFVALTYLGSLLLCVGSIMLFILIYRMWKVLPPKDARTTPAKALGFMFIPFFNFYWIFIALWGWAVDFNRMLKKYNIPSYPVSEYLALGMIIYCFATIPIYIGFSIAGIGWVTPFIQLPYILMLSMFIYQICSSLNALPSKVIAYADEKHRLIATSRLDSETSVSGYAVASLVLGILSIISPLIGILFGGLAIIFALLQWKVRKEGFSIAGLVTGIVGVTIWVAYTLIMVFAILLMTY